MERNPEKIRFVIDTNIIISSLLKDDSLTVKLLKSDLFDLFYPDDGLKELNFYQKYIISKRNKTLQKRTFNYALSFIMESVSVIPSEFYIDKIKTAYNVMKDIDEKDTPFLALAIKLNYPLWSNDKHLKKQDIVKCFNTQEIINIKKGI